ncbi:11472_t:CDS:2 [Acaulospora morrowiae]|uniref:11472_t:CDS:1 n=1 Tax=Acaulospora morrowiae TaxID=94023 RepID=A0A9N9B365_9GLOM|nr:11472_t:CDS:2 [Acaulospora morrowiae]
MKLPKFSLGLIVNGERLTKTKYKFLASLRIRHINSTKSSTIRLVSTKSNIYSYFLENGVLIKEDQAHQFLRSIPFITSTTRDLKNGTFRAIHCDIYIPLVEISFEEVKPSNELIQALEDALSNMDPYTSLCKVFKKFGHLIPHKMIIGRKLSRNCREFSPALCEYSPDQSKKISLTASSENYNEFRTVLNEWRNLHSESGFNPTYFKNTEGSIIEVENIESWISKDFQKLEIIEYSDLISTCAILDFPMRKEVEKCFKEKNQILMTGYITIEDIGAHYYRVEFDIPLKNSCYQVFGFVTDEELNVLEKLVVEFKFFTKFGFSIILKSLDDKQLIGALLSWMLIGIPREVGFYSRNTRDMTVLRIGELTFEKHDGNLTIKENKYFIKLPFISEIISESIVNIRLEFSENTSEAFIETRYISDTNEIQIISPNNFRDIDYLKEARVHYVVVSISENDRIIIPDIQMISNEKCFNHESILLKENMGYSIF